jgi:hypothetical protein
VPRLNYLRYFGTRAKIGSLITAVAEARKRGKQRASRRRREERSGLDLENVLYPVAGFTKAQVIDYYIRISPAILPRPKDLPVTLKRYPHGIAPAFFHEKNTT